MLLVEQRVDMALETCDRFYVLSGGKFVVEDKAGADGESRRSVIDAFLG